MIILFETAELKRICSIEKEAKKKLGAKSAKKLQRRLSNLMNAKNVFELPAGRPHPLKGNRSGQLALELDGGCRLVFEPANDPKPITTDGATDWAEVTMIRIVYIGDYHD